MRAISRAALVIAAGAIPLTGLAAASPFPKGHDQAYQAFVAALPAAVKGAQWLTKLNGVTAPPAAMTIGGKPVTYLFACKNHYCETDNANIFLAPGGKSYKAVLKIGGKQHLLGGAGPAEIACVRKLNAAGGALQAC